MIVGHVSLVLDLKLEYSSVSRFCQNQIDDAVGNDQIYHFVGPYKKSAQECAHVTYLPNLQILFGMA